MEINLLLRFIHVVFSIFTFGALSTVWIWALALPRGSRSDAEGQLRFWAPIGPQLAQASLVVPISGWSWYLPGSAGLSAAGSGSVSLCT